MDENPYQASADHAEAAARPTRLEAATWGANFGSKAGVAIGGALALISLAIRMMRVEQAGKSPDVVVDLIMAVPAVVIFGIIGALIGTAIGFVARYKPRDKHKEK